MWNTIFDGVFDTTTQAKIAVSDFLICVGIALVIGLILALVYRYRSQYTRSFMLTLAVLPATVCVVIMMVNGNIGAGVAVAGAFSLVRFRSAPGSAKEIGAIFIAMTAGLIAGMGYVGYAVLFTLVLSAAWLVYQLVGFGRGGATNGERVLRITVPEDLNYTAVFDEPLAQYTSVHELIKVKTTNLGSLFRLTYHITLRNAAQEKEFIDALRCRNGNLEITLARQEGNSGEL